MPSRPRGAALPQVLLAHECGGAPGATAGPAGGAGARAPARRLARWAEADLLERCSAEYAALDPPPRSTIALCYNADGTLLASTHGDHTVKVTRCATGRLARVLTGHRRTPWVVRFHPARPHLLASGSLDHEVRLWDVATGACTHRYVFGKPIASLAFAAGGAVLAVGCGHKLYVWEYGEGGAAGPGRPPAIVLRTRRSMRAVHFHPHGLPLLLTAEVQDASPTPALGPTLTDGPGGAYVAPRGAGASAGGEAPPGADDERRASSALGGLHLAGDASGAGGSAEAAAAGAGPGSGSNGGSPGVWARFRSTLTGRRGEAEAAAAAGGGGPRGPGWVLASPHLPVPMVPVGWELPFPASVLHPPRTVAAAVAGAPAGAAAAGLGGAWEASVMAAFSASVWNIIGDEQPPRVRLRLWRFDASKPTAPLEGGGAAPLLQVDDAVLCSEMGVHFSPDGRMLAATVAARASIDAAPAPAPLPEPAGAPAPGAGARAPLYLQPDGSVGVARPAAPRGAPDDGPQPMHTSDDDGAAPAEPRPPRVVFEVRLLSLDAGRLGAVAAARRIRAAHCLTSVQFSPACDHVLLAYGKKHVSLLRSLVAERGGVAPLHTILEVFRAADMGLARVLPSADDEINAACWHPAPGGGLAYGTKEGRLRVVAPRRGADEEDAVGPAGLADAPPQDPSGAELQGILLMQSWLQLPGAGGAGGGPGAAGGAPRTDEMRAMLARAQEQERQQQQQQQQQQGRGREG